MIPVADVETPPAGLRQSRPRSAEKSKSQSSGRRLALLVAALIGVVTTAARAGYRIENVSYPEAIRTGISAVTFTPDGSLVIATRLGEIWIRGASGGWRLFARGLDEPMGLVADSERTIFIAHKPELLRAVDRDGDGQADTFDVMGGKWSITQKYHEFFYGLKRDRAGNFYGAPSLESTGAKSPAHKEAYPALPFRGPRNLDDVLEPSGHRSEVLWRGWVVRIKPDGKVEPIAAGFRQANGIGLSPGEDLFVTDNQGDYKPSTGLLHVERGDFHGHAASLKWEVGFNAAAITTESLWRRLKTPAVVFPHGPLGVSPGEPVWDLSGGKFGPYAGQVFVGDYSRLVVRASLEKVAGAWQGAAFPFIGRNETVPYVTGDRLKTGVTRGAFGPDGSLYLAATSGQGAGSDGLQRISWDGKNSPDVHDIRLTDRGFTGDFAVGGTTRLPRPGETSLGAKEAPGESATATTPALIGAGARVYRFYCVACHQPDGRGIAGGAANFVDDQTRLAKADAALLEVIANGVEAKGMPAFAAIINANQRRAVLAYIRATFGAEHGREATPAAPGPGQP